MGTTITKRGRPYGFEKLGRFHKVSGNVAYGWAAISTVNGLPYFDTGDGTHSDHIPEDTLPDVAQAFMDGSRIGLDMHEGDQVADVVFAYPNTTDILKGLDLTGPNTGLAIGWRTSDAALLAKVASGERIGFSIGGLVTEWDIVDEAGNVLETYIATGKRGALTIVARTFGKSSAGYDGTDGRMKRRIFRAWKLAEISLVDAPMQEPALVGVVKGKAGKESVRKIRTLARVRKQAVLTSITDGHQHTIDLSDPAHYSGLTTSWDTAEGADYGHSHRWVYDDATGVVTLGEDSGHTHDVAASVPADVLSVATAREAAARAEIAAAATAIASGVPATPIEDEDSGAVIADDDAGGNVNYDDTDGSGQTVTIQVAMRRAENWTPGSDGASVPSMADQAQPKDHGAEIVSLKARLLRADRMATLTDAQRAHFGKLAGEDADAFLAKSAAQRDADVSAALERDPVHYTSKRTGKVYRKSQSDLGDLAKESDEQAEELAKARGERDDATFSKTARETLAHLAFKSEAGKYDDGVALIKAIHTGITDKDQRERVLTALKAADAVADLGFSANGDEGDPNKDPAVKKISNIGEAREELSKMASELAAKEGIKESVAKRRLLQSNKRARELYDAISASTGRN